MSYNETVEYLFCQMPMFERDGKSGYKEGLSNTLALDKYFGHPHRNYPTIHIAGTNGKGSCSHTLAAILQTFGYKVGLYTSPHLVDFSERIKINGVPVGKDYVVDFVRDDKDFIDSLHPSFFEVTTALAFKYFSDMKVDVAIIEVGLGGRLDCTNIITPVLSVITNISFDHTQFLGDTLTKIASEKAGIIKPGVPVVIGEATSETRPVFEMTAKEKNSPLIFAEDNREVLDYAKHKIEGFEYNTLHYGILHGILGGLYQPKNSNTSLVAFNVLLSECNEKLHIPYDGEIPANKLNEALEGVVRKTGLFGRWQTVGENPKVVCDTGHNTGGWHYLGKQLKEIKCRKMHVIFGMVNDKDIDSVVKLLPDNALYYFTKANNKRAVSEEKISEYASRYGHRGEAYPTVADAFRAACLAAEKEDFIFIGGSSYIVADFLNSCI
ncbi:bifunctional folylpolyglutamate synthase/dihydrofolate synthase [Xylanibacter muris]|uniref:Dihydrofolate synthase/folylpolyglutamate synthase n=1 Tax=Xylanibacter muris TaxID=2736290 RepID=A0ABX2AS09_9BACT|nr:folylpolyglutamate synthase/dihydrofolate synthase family protein [Xylanibacter muris]NPD93027.1 bifunctional folylpolyglutamate synthase/dihydrofolate synthase [Xylanibacter muris]